MRKAKKIIFIDSSDDAAAVSGIIRSGEVLPGGDSAIVAMSPTVRYRVGLSGFEADDTFDLFGTGSHKSVLDKSSRIMDWVRGSFDIKDEAAGISTAYNDSLAFWVRIVVNYCLRNIEIVQNAVDLCGAEQIAAFSSARRWTSNLFVMPEERFLADIVKKVSEARGLSYSHHPAGAVRSFVTYISSAVGYLAGLSRCAGKCIRFEMWQDGMVKRLSSIDKRPILFTTKSYQLDKLGDNLQSKVKDRQFIYMDGPISAGFRVPYAMMVLVGGKKARNTLSAKKRLDAFAQALEEKKDLFSYRGVDFSDIVYRKLRTNIIDYVLWQIIWAVKLEKALHNIKPEIVFSTGNRTDDVMLAELSRKMGIPTVLVSHGSHVKPKDHFECIEWGELGRVLMRGPFSHYALQTPIEEGFLEVFPTKSRIVKAGPLTWGRPINRKSSKAVFSAFFGSIHDPERCRVLVHAGTAKRSRLYTYETFDEYIHALKDLASAVENMDNTLLVIRFRPLDEITIDAIKHLILFSDKVRLSVSEPFGDILGMADLLVSYSSTAIETALLSRIPVLLYGGGGRYQRLPAYEIRQGLPVEPRAVYQVKDAGDLAYGIAGILDNKIAGRDSKALFGRFAYSDTEKDKVESLIGAGRSIV